MRGHRALLGRRSPVRLPALLAPWLLLASCGGSEGDARGAGGSAERSVQDAGTESVTADLLASRRPGPGGAEVPVVGEDPAGDPAATPSPPEAAPRPASPPALVEIDTLGYDAGSSLAPLRVLEFSDFGCGYCRAFHLETYPSLHREYVETGRVEWKYVPIVLGQFGPAAEAAAHAGECAGEQGGFGPMRDRIFERQSEWRRADQPMAVFRSLAREQELDLGRWERCVDERWRADRLRAGTQLAFQAGLRGTPTFVVVGVGMIPGALPLDVFRQVLDGALAAPTGPVAPPRPPGR